MDRDICFDKEWDDLKQSHWNLGGSQLHMKEEHVGKFRRLVGGLAALLVPLLMAPLALMIISCGGSTPTGETIREQSLVGEGATGSGGGEEILTRLAPDETFNQIRAGTRLVMSYDPAINAFTGTVRNTTSYRLLNVRVEVHLEDGPELGPTPPIDLAPDEVQPVELQSTVSSFIGWVALVRIDSQGR